MGWIKRVRHGGADEAALDDPSPRTEIEAAVLALLRGDRATRSIAA